MGNGASSSGCDIAMLMLELSISWVDCTTSLVRGAVLFLSLPGIARSGTLPTSLVVRRLNFCLVWLTHQTSLVGIRGRAACCRCLSCGALSLFPHLLPLSAKFDSLLVVVSLIQTSPPFSSPPRRTCRRTTRRFSATPTCAPFSARRRRLPSRWRFARGAQPFATSSSWTTARLTASGSRPTWPASTTHTR